MRFFSCYVVVNENLSWELRFYICLVYFQECSCLKGCQKCTVNFSLDVFCNDNSVVDVTHHDLKCSDPVRPGEVAASGLDPGTRPTTVPHWNPAMAEEDNGRSNVYFVQAHV